MYSKNLKIAIVTNILSPYRVPLFNQLAQEPGIDLRVFLCAKSEPNRHWEWPDNIYFNYEIGGTFKWSLNQTKNIYFNPGLIPRLRRFCPDVVISGSIGLVSVMALLSARICGARFILWGEGMIGSDGWIGKLMRPLRKFLVREADAIIASSKSASDFFHYYGANLDRITIALITPDTKVFEQKMEEVRKNKELLKRKYGLCGPVILYVGQLEHYKGVDLLLRAFEKLLNRIPEAELVIVGTGTLLEDLKKILKPESRSNVHFIGFKQPNDLPEYFCCADVFTLFSRAEPFGLVIAEALIAGLPVVCSKFAGASYDLIEQGQNGFIIDPEDIHTNSQLMTKILLDYSLRMDMGRRSKEISHNCTIEKTASAMLEVVNRLLVLDGKDIRSRDAN